MKHILLTIITAISINSYAQNCKYEKNEIDKFTKKKVVITKSEKVFGTVNTSGFYSVKQDGDNYYIEFDYLVQTSFSGTSRVATNIAVKEKDQLMFLLENDEVVTLESSSTVQTQMKSNMASGLVNWELNDVMYPITKEQLTVLQSAKTKTLRIYRTIGYDAQNFGQQDFMDVDIKKGNQDDIQRLIQCVLLQ
jgi:hypothetical protein